MISLIINGQLRTVDADPDMPLLWALRELLQLTGTKYGCGVALCGACTVHLDSAPVRACVVPISAVAGRRVTWIEAQVPQCGYCQPGQIMSAAALLARKPSPTDADIDDAMGGNICRCGTYQRIRKAIHLAAAIQRGEKTGGTR
jgi:aerobic-type carbon monoxide dehydrogenase small subunit (CoxS/CutS family)